MKHPLVVKDLGEVVRVEGPRAGDRFRRFEISCGPARGEVEVDVARLEGVPENKREYALAQDINGFVGAVLMQLAKAKLLTPLPPAEVENKSLYLINDKVRSMLGAPEASS